MQAQRSKKTQTYTSKSKFPHHPSPTYLQLAQRNKLLPPIPLYPTAHRDWSQRAQAEARAGLQVTSGCTHAGLQRGLGARKREGPPAPPFFVTDQRLKLQPSKEAA